MKKIGGILAVIVLISVIVGLVFYSRLPLQMASHWDAQGNVDGYMNRFWGVFSLPILFAVLVFLFLVLPKIDPLKKNIEKFMGYYLGFLVVFFLFMFAVYLQTILWNLGIKISPLVVFPIGFAGLMYYLSILMLHAKRNWFIGVRTPWTMSSDNVWDKTHLVAAKLYRICAILSLIGVFFANYAFYFVIIPILAVSLYLFVYSYLEFKKEGN